jgi:putative endonuclease
MAEHNDLGKLGEDLAVEYLIQQGYEIVETNWRHHKAEIDIICTKDSILAVVEVKSRSSNAVINPEEAITTKKIKLLTNAIDTYVVLNDLDVDVRFDIISVSFYDKKPVIKHITDAFYHF